jgi:hypothetical protein
LKGIDEAPDICENGKPEAEANTEEQLQRTPDDRIEKIEIESDEGKTQEGKEFGSLPEKTPNTDEGSHEIVIAENKENRVENPIDPQEGDYKWEVSFCGVDIPLVK